MILFKTKIFIQINLVSTNIPSARTIVKSETSNSTRPPTITAFSQANNIEFIDYNRVDVTR
jgi:hypothetical protein